MILYFMVMKNHYPATFLNKFVWQSRNNVFFIDLTNRYSFNHLYEQARRK